LRFLHGARQSLASAQRAEVKLRATQSSYANQVKSLTETLAKPEVPDREVL
jgi:hypothetical protein